jgi:hypothetical protein
METNLETENEVIDKTAVISNEVLAIYWRKIKFKIEFSKLVKVCLSKLQIWTNEENEGSLFSCFLKIVLFLTHSWVFTAQW